MEDEETLETSAVVCELSDAVQGKINDFLTNGVVTTGVVVGSIFLARDQLLRVEQLAVCTGTNFVNDRGFEIQKDTAWDVFASTSFGEKRVERIVTTTDGLIGRHLTIRLDTMLKAVQFPTGITNLNTSLTKMN
jgi:hypothetical protein